MYLSGEGVYLLMNVEALQISQSKVVMDDNEIVLVGNTRDILSVGTKGKAKRATSRALLLGGPTFYKDKQYGELQPLDGAQKEVELLAKILANS